MSERGPLSTIDAEVRSSIRNTFPSFPGDDDRRDVTRPSERRGKRRGERKTEIELDSGAKNGKGVKGRERGSSETSRGPAGIRYPRLISRTSPALFYHSSISIAFFFCCSANRPRIGPLCHHELFISRNGQTVFAVIARNLRFVWRILRNALVVFVPAERINLCLLSCSRNSLSFIFFPRISSYIRGVYRRSNIRQSIKVQFEPSDMGRESDQFA